MNYQIFIEENKNTLYKIYECIRLFNKDITFENVCKFAFYHSLYY